MSEQRLELERRPSPEALLAAAQRGDNPGGRLKIFVGAAPGVGKTYEMLETARARKAEGVDVIVGIVETHGRVETQALLEGLEILPRRQTVYKGRELEELDLDAVLARRPAIVLVDELAHTNAPGMRHPKRYLDVEELLNNGIDVYTTLNIQHIESLNDVVAQITRIRVRETVPDSILDKADDIKLVDLAPADLIERLKQGKVYIPKQAERALRHYFSAGNLTALRELALRRTAERVDDQLLDHMQAHGIPGPWAAGERILVCISEDPRAAGLVRYTKRLADRLHAPWTALYIQSRRGLSLSEEDRDRIADTLRLVERLGGEARTMPGIGRRIADDVIAFAHASNATQIVTGKSKRSRWFEMLHGSVVHDLVRRGGNISVHVVAGGELTQDPIPKKTVRAADESGPDLIPYFFACLAVAVATAVSMLLRPVLGIENIDLILLTAVVGVAVRFGLLPSLVASVLCSLSYNFFFLPPLFTLSIADATNVAAFAFFALTAFLVSNFAGRVHTHAREALMRARSSESLYTFSRKLAGVGTLDDVLWATAYQVASMLKVHVVVLLPEDGRIALKMGYPPEDTLEDADLAAANWAWNHNRSAGRGADTLPGARRLFLPMRTSRATIGVIGIDSDKPGPLFTPDQRRLLDALVDQAALAIERVHLVEDADRVRRALETDRLRAAVLTSISHDLKTPLAGVLGAASALRDLSHALDDSQKADLLATIIEESERLNRFIGNVLDMTRLEAGALSPNFAQYELGELVSATLQRASKVLTRHKLEFEASGDRPLLVRVDAVLLEQALFNLLDNAAKHAPSGSSIRLQGWRDASLVRLQVLDEGPGIPPAEIERVFDKFYRAQKADRVRAGTGLGLPIARGFIEAMQGTVNAANRSDRSGAVFTITLPLPAAAATGAAA